MTSPIRNSIPTPLEAAYKEQVRLSVRNSRPANGDANGGSGRSRGLPEDLVTLSSGRSDVEPHPAKLKPSQPVTHAERQALQAQFSIYG